MTTNATNDATGAPGTKRRASLERYWISNMRIVAVLIAIWASVSLGCGVLFADRLNQFRLPGTGYPLVFWFAHQGSIMIFVLLILAYCILMNRLDAKHRKELKQIAEDAS